MKKTSRFLAMVAMAEMGEMSEYLNSDQLFFPPKKESVFFSRDYPHDKKTKRRRAKNKVARKSRRINQKQ